MDAGAKRSSEYVGKMKKTFLRSVLLCVFACIFS